MIYVCMEGYYWWVILLNEVLLIHWFTVDNNYIHKLTLSNSWACEDLIIMCCAFSHATLLYS